MIGVPTSVLFAVGAVSLVALAMVGHVARSKLVPLLQVHSLERLDESDDVFRGLVVCASVALTAVAWSGNNTDPR